MKKKIMIIMIGILLIGVNVFAQGQGDLQVNGSVGVGITPVTTAKIRADGSNTSALLGTSSTDGTGTVAAVKGIMNVSTADNTAQGLSFLLNYNSSGAAGAGIIAVNDSSMSWNTNATDGLMSTALIQLSNNVNNAHTGTTTPVLGYGINLLSAGGSGSGSVHYSAFYNHIGIQNLGDRFRKSPGVLMDGTVSGIWIAQQTRGSSNYGIVLDGNGSGSDIVLGPNQEARIYSATETEPGNTDGVGIWVEDEGGNQTQISPHDPKTGDWIYYSKNVKTGRTVRVNMEKLVKAVERLTGETFMIESIEEIK